MEKTTIKPAYYDTLVDIKDIINKNMTSFTSNADRQCAHLIYRICFNEFRLEEVAGYFIKNDRIFLQSWNRDPINNLYISLSINQRSKNFPEILIANKKDYANVLQEDWEARENHWKVVLGAPFQKSIEKILNDFIELHPEKKDQIIM